MDTLTLLESKLGPSDHIKGGEYNFECPHGCGRKLGVNLDREIFFCVICGFTSPKGASASEKMRDMRAGQWYGGGTIAQLLAYLGHNSLADPPRNDRKERPPEDVFPLSRFRLLLTELFSTNPSTKLTEQDSHYLAQRGFCQDYWRERNVRVSIPVNPLNAFSASLAWERLKELTTAEERVLFHITNKNGDREAWLKPGRILLPYQEDPTGLVTAARSHLPLKLPNVVRYIWAPGSPASRSVYNLQVLKTQPTKILLTEGEFKTALPSLFGIPTLGLPGITTAHDYCALRISRTPSITCVGIGFDTENPDAVEDEAKKLSRTRARDNVEAGFQHLQELLMGLDLQVIRSRLPIDGAKVDYDSFILKHGPDMLKRYLRREGLSF
jgi:hypothetical protein